MDQIVRLSDRLFDTDLDFETIDKILDARWPARILLLHGLPACIVTRLLRYDDDPCTFKGTLHTRNIADLRGHHLTRKHQSPRYAMRDRNLVAQEAAELLQQRRSEIKAKVLEQKESRGKPYIEEDVVPLPGYTTGKTNTAVYQPQAPTRVENKKLQNYYQLLSDFLKNERETIDSELDTYINDSADDEAEEGVRIFFQIIYG